MRGGREGRSDRGRRIGESAPSANGGRRLWGDDDWEEIDLNEGMDVDCSYLFFCIEI